MRRLLPFLLLVAMSACGSEPKPATTNTAATAPRNAQAPRVDPNVPAPFTAESLLAAYSADPAAFKQTYLGRDLEVKGTVESIVFDANDPNHVRGIRLVAGTADPKTTVLCSFPEQKKVLKGDLKVVAGGPVTFKGSIVGNANGLEVRITTLY